MNAMPTEKIIHPNKIKSRKRARNLPVIRDQDKIKVANMLRLRRQVLKQPLDLVDWDVHGNMITPKTDAQNPQLGAIICRWITKGRRIAPYEIDPETKERVLKNEDGSIVDAKTLRSQRAPTGYMESEYPSVMTNYINSGGFPMELLDGLPQEPPTNDHATPMDDVEVQPTMHGPAPVIGPKYVVWRPPPTSSSYHTGSRLTATGRSREWEGVQMARSSTTTTTTMRKTPKTT